METIIKKPPFIFNQLNKDIMMSNLQFLEKQITVMSYGKNSLQLQLLDFDTNEMVRILFPKGKDQKLLKVMKSLNAGRKVYNLGISSSHLFHVQRFNLTTKVWTKEGLTPYAKLSYLLFMNHKANISTIVNIQQNTIHYIDPTTLQRDMDQGRKNWEEWKQQQAKKGELKDKAIVRTAMHPNEKSDYDDKYNDLSKFGLNIKT